jgi:hypothetical protein
MSVFEVSQAHRCSGLEIEACGPMTHQSLSNPGKTVVMSAPSLMPVRRASAVLVWVLLLLMASLGSLSQGSLDEGSFATVAGVDDAAAMSQRVVCALSVEQASASSDGPQPAITATSVSVISSECSTTPAAVRVSVKSPQRYFPAQPRAPPTI